MRGVQGVSEKTQVDRFCPLSVWMGVVGALTFVRKEETPRKDLLWQRLLNFIFRSASRNV